MIRQMQELKGGLGRWTLHPEMDEEVQEMQRIFPDGGLPPGVKLTYEWTPRESAGALPSLVITTELDPAYAAPPPAKAPPADDPLNEAPPPSAKLADWKLEDLVTKAAELGVKHKAGETKASLIGRLLPAWQQRHDELAKR